MLYRARQRGFLELDIIVGEWATRNLTSKSDEFLRSFAEVLDEENPNLFKWLTGQEHLPQEFQTTRHSCHFKRT